MKTWFLVFAAIMVVFVAGCLTTPEQQARVDAVTARLTAAADRLSEAQKEYADLVAKSKEVMAKVQAGTVTTTDAKAIMDLYAAQAAIAKADIGAAKDTYDATKADLAALKASGMDWSSIIIAIVGSVLTTFVARGKASGGLAAGLPMVGNGGKVV